MTDQDRCIRIQAVIILHSLIGDIENETEKNNTTPTQRTKKETPRNQHQRNDNNHPRPLN